MGHALESCIRLSCPGSGIVLIEDGVLACVHGTQAAGWLERAARGRRLYALDEDLKARGIPRDRVPGDVTVVDYAGFVDLCVEYSKVQAWF
jgi:tRNA 2-thiouridine synthesizing protein B